MAHSLASAQPEELASLRTLVASAVGYDEARGDVITLQSMRFEPVEGLWAPKPGPGIFANTMLDMMTLLRWAFLLAVLAIFILFVLRPILRAARGDGATGCRALRAGGPGARGGDLERFDAGSIDPGPRQGRTRMRRGPGHAPAPHDRGASGRVCAVASALDG